MTVTELYLSSANDLAFFSDNEGSKLASLEEVKKFINESIAGCICDGETITAADGKFTAIWTEEGGMGEDAEYFLYFVNRDGERIHIY